METKGKPMEQKQNFPYADATEQAFTNRDIFSFNEQVFALYSALNFLLGKSFLSSVTCNSALSHPSIINDHSTESYRFMCINDYIFCFIGQIKWARKMIDLAPFDAHQK